MDFTNPRLTAEFDDWPIGSGNRGKCVFKVEHGKKGVRVSRTTTNKHGQWCKTKYDTYCEKAVIVDGDDGRTYILKYVKDYDFISVVTSDFKDARSPAFKDNNPQEFATFMELVNSA